MRPQHIKQEPYHFIKRCPRSRRQNRGPSEFEKVIGAALSFSECLSPTVHPMRALDGKLLGEIKNVLSAGWDYTVQDKQVTEDEMAQEFQIKAAVKFMRKSKD